jgi:hypothetical protein
VSQGYDPVATMSAVETGAAKLADAANVYHDAVERFEEAEEAYEHEMAVARTKADHASLNDEKIKKLPSKERRQDIALVWMKREKPDVYAEFFASKAHKEAVAVKYRALAASVSARQSLLKAAGP